MAVLQTHGWPGNVRQLRNIVERLLILASDDVTEAVTADLLPPTWAPAWRAPRAATW
jgi:two-component system nitrogen regulation response regulator NtrX